jgi:phage shock protein A
MAELAEVRPRLMRLATHMANLESHIEFQDRHVAQQDARVTQLEARVSQLQRRVRRVSEQRDEALVALDRTTSSRSWRATAPMRRLVRVLGRRA